MKLKLQNGIDMDPWRSNAHQYMLYHTSMAPTIVQQIGTLHTCNVEVQLSNVREDDIYSTTHVECSEITVSAERDIAEAIERGRRAFEESALCDPIDVCGIHG